MKSVFIAIALLASLINTAIAGDGFPACKKFEDNAEKLACMRAEVEKTLADLEAGRQSWKVDSYESAMDDSATVTMALDSKEIINCGWNQGDRIALILRCQENTTVLYFHTGCHMVSSYSDYGAVTYRLDKDKSRKIKMQESSDNKALGHWSGRRSIPFVKSMFGKDTLLVRMTPFNENPFEASFNIAGLADAIAPLRKACHW